MMKKSIGFFIAVGLITSVAVRSETRQSPSSQESKKSLPSMVFQNFVDLVPFLLTVGVRLAREGREPAKFSDKTWESVEGLMTNSAAVLINTVDITVPATVGLAFVAKEVVTIEGSRELAVKASQDQYGLTRQQDQIIGNGLVMIPLSIFVAKMLAVNDVQERALWIAGGYLLTFGENSPLAFIKSVPAKLLDYVRIGER